MGGGAGSDAAIGLNILLSEGGEFVARKVKHSIRETLISL